jgi:hypothetical protein
MRNLAEDIRRLGTCYRELAERSAHPHFREGFAKLAAYYDSIAAWREAIERSAAFNRETESSH